MDEPTPEERHRLAVNEMRIYDALGPATRKAISIAPISLDARKLPMTTGLSTAQLRRLDERVADQLIGMMDREYGRHSGKDDWLRRPAPRTTGSLISKYFPTPT